MQLLSADPTIVLKKIKKLVLTTKSWKKHPQKLLRMPQIYFFFLTAMTAQTAQTEEFMFQNVAYWSTVCRTGGLACLPAAKLFLRRAKWGLWWRPYMLRLVGVNLL